MSDQVCVCCNQTATSGSATGGEVERWIDCHLCHRWSHIDCFESETNTEGAVTPRLWNARKKYMHFFKFTCSKCGPSTSLPEQLETQGILSRQKLIDLGVDDRHLAAIETPGAVGGVPPRTLQPSVAAPSTSTADLQLLMRMMYDEQEKVRAQERAEREAERAQERAERAAERAQDRADRERLEQKREDDRAYYEQKMETLLRQNQEAAEHRGDGLVQALSNLQFGIPATLETKSKSSGLKLPELKLPTFSGDVLKWPEFWDIFRAMIDENRDLSNVQKLSHLRANLSGSAKDTISSLRMTDGNYNIAVELLKSRFGDNSKIKNQLLSQLKVLPCCSMKFQELQQQFLTVEGVLKQLQNLNANLEGDFFWDTLIGKFPEHINLKLDKARAEADQRCIEWTVELYLESLERIVKRQEKEFEYRKIRQAESSRHSNPPAPPQQSSSGMKGSSFLRPRSSADAMVSIGANQKPKRNSIPITPSSSTNRGSSTFRETPNTAGSSQNRSYPCVYCQGDHFPDDCPKYTKAKERKFRLIESNRCYMCLREGHFWRTCPSPWKARPCKGCKNIGYHHYSLCREWIAKKNPTLTNTTGAVSNTVSGSQSNDISIHNERAAEGSYSVFGRQSAMQTAEIEVMNRDKQKSRIARVFFDSGSTISWMSESFARYMELQLKNPVAFSVTAFRTKPRIVEGYEVEIDLLVPKSRSIRCEFMVVDKLTTPIYYPSLSTKDFEFLEIHRDLYPMAPGSMPCHSDVFKPDILIGQDYFWSIMENKDKIELPSGLILLPTKFGYLLAGNNSVKGKVYPQNASCVKTYFTQTFPPFPQLSVKATEDKSIERTLAVEDLWDLDRIGISDSPVINDDDMALERFNESIKFEDGRYHATWMWKSNEVDLPTNYDLALRRFQSLVKRFKGDPETLKKYTAIIEEQRKQGIIEKVTGETVCGPREHYLSHHPVITPLKETTKVRIVYDASAKINKHSKSLNECLCRGPVILPDLCGLLMRFRTYPKAILADIEKAFLQIGLQTPDRDVTRFLWLREPEKLDLDGGKNIQIYRFCKVAFGIICSPSILEATIKYHLNSVGTPVALNVAENIYVDNVLVGANDSRQAFKIYTEAKDIFSQASMNLREWTSNCTEFMESVPEQDRAKSNKPWIKVLGLQWDLVHDHIQIASPNESNLPAGTKREVLHAFAQIFDPLGYFSPVTFYGKLFLEKLWKLKKTWDEPLPEELKEEWQSIATTLTDVGSARMPRFLGTKPSISDYQLMVFCDASTKAYGIAVYLRFFSGEGYRSHLIFSKNRLPPKVKDKNKELRATSLPRLELLGVYIGVKAADFARRELRLPIFQVTVWTDSECALHWIKSKKPLSVFVENRLQEIKKPKNITFRYVKSEDNPADLTTRGRTVAEIESDLLWWNGPLWLNQPEESWPDTNLPELTPAILDSINKETKCEISLFVGGDPAGQKSKIIPAGGVSQIIDAKRFSSLRKLLGTTCYCFRFIKWWIGDRLSAKSNSKHTVDFFRDVELTGALTAKELNLAEDLWVKSTQRNAYSDVFADMYAKKRNDLQQQLGLRIDPGGFLRCCGRLGNADLEYDTKFPRLLPGKDHFTRLVVESKHRELYHAGVPHTLSQSRMRFWIPQGRRVVRDILLKCLVCKRHSGGPFRLQPMPQLPRERVSRMRPFQVVGIDYMGPFYCKEEGKDVRKLWICLFTCLTVRAIHLELVRGLDAPEFVDCLRRFVSRYGKPDKIISDNAPTFKLADKFLNSVWSKVVLDPDTVEYFTSNRIEWTFITEFAPWQGGFYERLVGVVKRSLRKTLGRKFFTEGQLNTAVHEIEAVVNSRPITFVYSDLDGGFPLSPSDFLGFAKSRIGFPQIELDHSDPEYLPKLDSTEKLVRYLKNAHKKLDQFWNTWQNEYLLSLRERYQIEHKHPRVNVPALPETGDVVLLKEDNASWNTWKLVRVVKISPRHNGEVNRVRIRTSTGVELDRPVNLLYPLELPLERAPTSASEAPEVTATRGRNQKREVESRRPVPVPAHEKRRPSRKAAQEAKEKIYDQFTELGLALLGPAQVMQIIEIANLKNYHLFSTP